jgi:mono/diheme cytochrome c family protein
LLLTKNAEAKQKMLDKRGFAVLASAAFFLLACGIAFAGGHPNVASVKPGDLLFHQKCAGCHNKQPGDTSPFGPPNLHGIFQKKLLTPAEASDVIRHGRGSMPGFGTLSDMQVKQLLAYLKMQ